MTGIYKGPMKTEKDFDKLLKSLKDSESETHEVPQTTIDYLDGMMSSMTEGVKESYVPSVRTIPEGVSGRTLVYGTSSELANALQESDYSGDMDSYGRF